MDIKELLNRKFAGIPLMWILLVVAGVALYGAFRLKPIPEDTGDQEGDIAEDSDQEGDITNGDQPVFLVRNPPFTPENPNPPVEDTNELWGRRAIEWLTAQGATLSLATSAITKYLNAETLSFAEGALRDKAVKQFGLPPEGLLQSPTQPYKGPGTKQGTPPTTHTVRGTSDDSFGELARIYYGLDNSDTRRLLSAANPSLTTAFGPGTKVRIPAYHDPKYFKATNATRTLYAIARKNGTTAQRVAALNPSLKFPVKVGTRVRIR